MSAKPKLDPCLPVPKRFQKRIDAWEGSPPNTQFKMYGPLIGYLSQKFPLQHFLIKAQGLLRQIQEDDECESDWDDTGDYLLSGLGLTEADHQTIRNGANNSGVGDDVAMEVVSASVADEYCDADTSIDSCGAKVLKEVKKFPDFIVCQYFGSDDDENVEADIIRVIIEVGYHPKTVVRQLKNYLHIAGSRWKERLLGLAIYQNEVLIITMTDSETMEGEWISLFSKELVEQLDKMIEISLAYEQGLGFDPDAE